jgi:DNA polymerase-3 subunit beta
LHWRTRDPDPHPWLGKVFEEDAGERGGTGNQRNGREYFMIAKFETGALKRAVDTVKQAVGKHTLPVLGHVQVSFKGENAELRCTDLDLEIRDLVPVTVEGKTQDFCVPAGRLSAALACHETELVEIHCEKMPKIRLVSDVAETCFLCLPGEEMPAEMVLQSPLSTQISGNGLGTILARVEAMQSCDESRYVLNGVHVLMKPGTVQVTATDGRRLGRCFLQTPEKISAELIIPSRLVRLLVLLTPEKGDVEIFWSKASDDEKSSLFSMVHGRVRLTGRLIEGQFPNADQVIPAKTTPVFTASQAQLLEALDKCMPVVDKADGLQVKLEQRPEGMEVSSENKEIGYVRVTVTSLGKPWKVSLNGGLLRDALESVDTPQVTFEQADPSQAAVLRNGDNVFVIMPMRSA